MTDVVIVGAACTHSVDIRSPGWIKVPTQLAWPSPTPASTGRAVEYAFGGSADGGRRRHGSCRRLGLTGVPFINVANGCATGGQRVDQRVQRHTRRGRRHRRRCGIRQAPACAARPASPAKYGLEAWYGQTGLMLTTQFFGMKIQRYMHEHGISRRGARQGGRQSIPQRSTESGTPGDGTPLSEDEILGATMIAEPLTQYMFCSPGEGRCGAGAHLAREGVRSSPSAGVPEVRGAPNLVRTAHSRCSVRG